MQLACESDGVDVMYLQGKLGTVYQDQYNVMRELLSTHHGTTAKLQKAKTTLFLYFPGKDVPNMVLSRKDPIWRICLKVTHISQQVNTAPCLLMCDLCKFMLLSKTLCCGLAPSRPLQLILICPVSCE